MTDARYVELEGIDHLPWAGDAEAVLGPKPAPQPVQVPARRWQLTPGMATLAAT